MKCKFLSAFSMKREDCRFSYDCVLYDTCLSRRLKERQEANCSWTEEERSKNETIKKI